MCSLRREEAWDQWRIQASFDRVDEFRWNRNSWHHVLEDESLVFKFLQLCWGERRPNYTMISCTTACCCTSNSHHLWKSGKRYIGDEEIQRKDIQWKTENSKKNGRFLLTKLRDEIRGREKEALFLLGYCCCCC